MTHHTKGFICIVEDDTATNELMAFLLRQNGYHPIQFYDSYIDWEKLTSNVPSLFIIDLELPGGGGAGVIQSIRESAMLKDIPIAIISASKKVDEVAEQHGITEFLCKPFDVDDFKRLLERISKA